MPSQDDDVQIWFLTGSQSLYGEETLRQVEDQSRQIAEALAGQLGVRLVWRPVLTTADAIRRECLDATASDECIGVIAWMHTFSPAKMWIGGLESLRKPLLHMHTQANVELPWSEIDMDFMNLNQAAHGDREFGYIQTRLGVARKTVAGHVSDPRVAARIGVWSRAAAAAVALRGMRLVRFGDNMRDVAVTEGDKVEAALRYGARIEWGLRRFLTEGGYTAFTTNFQDLGGLRQLPGLAVQRLMADGYGFGGEGDWKTALLLRTVKAMAAALPGGTSFMEDYTYHLVPGQEKILGAHMLEVCPSIAAHRPRIEIHPLAIGNREDPVRLVFHA